jgi:hypothetical protein
VTARGRPARVRVKRGGHSTWPREPSSPWSSFLAPSQFRWVKQELEDWPASDRKGVPPQPAVAGQSHAPMAAAVRSLRRPWQKAKREPSAAVPPSFQ